MKTQSILKTVLLTAGFSAFTLIGGAQAQVLLTGGDSTDGWVAPSNSVLAYNFSDGGHVSGDPRYTADGPDSATQTIQGVTFTSWNGFASSTAPTVVGGVTTTSNLDGTSFYTNTPNGFGVSANDTAMAAVVQTLFYNFSSPNNLTFSISGLAAGNYILDEFVMSGDQTRTAQSFSINGTTTNTFDEVQGNAYVVKNEVTVTCAGTLNFAVSGAVTPELGGFDLSAVPAEAPEPSGVTSEKVPG